MNPSCCRPHLYFTEKILSFFGRTFMCGLLFDYTSQSWLYRESRFFEEKSSKSQNFQFFSTGNRL